MKIKSKILVIVSIFAIMCFALQSFAQSAPTRVANIECALPHKKAPTDRYVWLNTQTHQMWLGKDDSNINHALGLPTSSWRSNGPFSVVGISTMQMGQWGTATYRLVVTPNGQNKGTLVITISSTQDGSSNTMSPEPCFAI